MMCGNNRHSTDCLCGDVGEIDVDEANRLFREWEDVVAKEIDCASRAGLLAEELSMMGIDVNDPPEWINA